MSEYLKTVLHERATSVAFRPTDLAGVRRAGDRRILLRRTASGLAGVVAMALIGAIIVALRGSGPPAQVLSPWPADAVTWATGSTIHVGARRVEVGHPVRAYVRTGAGFAVIDDADDVYSVTAGGVRKIGHSTVAPPFDSDASDLPRIAADPRGTLVGWTGEDPSGGMALRTYDQATGETRSRVVSGRPEDNLFYAIDGRTGYWRTTAGTYQVDLDTGAERRLATGEDLHSFEIYSAENGVVAFRRGDSIRAGRSVEDGRMLINYGQEELVLVGPPIRLSPTGAWVSVALAYLEKVAEDNYRGTRDTADVFNTGTGAHVVLDLPDVSLPMPVVWLDEVTLQVAVVLGANHSGTPPPTDAAVEANLYTCTVPDGTCRVAVNLGRLSMNAPNLPVLPDGRGVSYS